MQQTRSISVVIIIALSLTGMLRAEDVALEADARGDSRMNIVVLPFQPSVKEARQKPRTMPHDVVKNDLLLSSRFNIIPSAKYDSSLCSEKQVPVYIDGHYHFRGDEIVIEAGLYDCRRREIMMGKKYSGGEDYIRGMMHRFSDEVILSLFGEKGIAQTKIAFVCKMGKSKEIHQMDYDGHHVKAVTRNGSINILPSWSPERKRLIYVSYLKGKPQLYMTSLSKLNHKAFIKSKGLNSSPEWSRIENRIAFASSYSGNTEIYVIDADGGRAEKLTRHWGIDTAPTWSPTGYEIAFTSDRNGGPQIFIMDCDGANVRRLTYEGKYNDSPSWSPAGDRIAYAGFEEGGFNIYTASLDGSEVKKLTLGPGSSEHPAWSPDGRHIAFSKALNGKSDIYIMNEDGTDSRRITRSGKYSMPSWSNY